MLNQPTIEKLYAMRRAAMAEAWNAQQKDADIASMGFDERFSMLVDTEYLSRENRRISTEGGPAEGRSEGGACVPSEARDA